MKKRVLAHFEGHVQGVGFRQGTRQVAAGYEVTGTVRNLPDGRVELCAEGEEEEVRAFLDGIGESQIGGLVRHRDEAWAEAENLLRGFRVIP